MKKKVILLGLNELNFKYIKHYIANGFLPTFKHYFGKYGYAETTSENQYELLEPWIQWVTIHTGKSYDEHQVFRLGDIVGRNDLKQIFEKVEETGATVGAISPFNTENRLKSPAFFVPDPWTQTTAAGDKFVTQVSKAVSQAVNDNAKDSVSKKSIIHLLKAFLKVVPPTKYTQYVSLVSSLKSKVGIKAVILDKLLGDIFMQQWKKHQPDFASLFLNTGAHFQHHYMFNSLAYNGEFKNPEWYCPSSQDPLLMVLKEYDSILKRLSNLSNIRLIVCTGLHQEPHKRLTFYWRLKNHQTFLKEIGILKFERVVPRMSRDFLVEFSSITEASQAEKQLATYQCTKDSEPIFSIDNRGNSLFVELTYPHEITEDFIIRGERELRNFKEYVSFVAIKNGEHDGIGYYMDTDNKNVGNHSFIPLTEIYSTIEKSFG